MLLLGFMALSMALQGADYLNSRVSVPKRIIFLIAALLLLLPLPRMLNLAGLIVLAAGWLPGFFVRGKQAAAP
jgi:hypothetical protein